jgi:hypothetical protein
MAGMYSKWLRTTASTLLRLTVLVITVTLLVLMFERGGWWIAACLAWLPVNWFVVAHYGDDKHASGGAGPFFID